MQRLLETAQDADARASEVRVNRVSEVANRRTSVLPRVTNKTAGPIQSLFDFSKDAISVSFVPYNAKETTSTTCRPRPTLCSDS